MTDPNDQGAIPGVGFALDDLPVGHRPHRGVAAGVPNVRAKTSVVVRVLLEGEGDLEGRVSGGPQFPVVAERAPGQDDALDRVAPPRLHIGSIIGPLP
jgi:hypothetical protein